jgi:nucleoside-diphosphate-sugar epimerase
MSNLEGKDMQTLLLTGGAGFIGANLVLTLRIGK